MDSVTSPPPDQTTTRPLGVGEPLPVVDLPEPEEWAKSAAQGLFALLNGEVPGSGDTTTVTLLAILLLLVVFAITVVSRKITRGLELANPTAVGLQLLFLLVIDLLVVPFSVWWDGLRGLVTPALPPEGSDATLLGGLAGFTALASGLNWYVMNHYRDKGYGMGSRVGYLAGLRGERRDVRAVGMTFPDPAPNTASDLHERRSVAVSRVRRRPARSGRGRVSVPYSCPRPCM